jgi:pimeloyl-[acyl-carrier protein] synthase
VTVAAGPALRPRDAAFRADPYPTYATLRARHPVHRDDELGAWLVTRHADVAAALRDRRLGFPDVLPELDALAPAGLDPPQRLRLEAARLTSRWLLQRNPPDHTRLRRTMHAAFTPARVRAMQERIAGLAEELVAAARDGEFEVIGGLAYPLPLAVTCDLLELPVDSGAPLRRWADDLALTIDVSADPVAQARGSIAINRLADLFRDHVAGREASRPESLLGLLLDARARGELDEAELVAHCVLLFFAGHSTTRHLIGNGVLALLRHPDELARLRDDPGLLPTAVDELLRYETPVQLLARTALVETEVGGTRIAAGDVVHLMLGAAHRDASVFADPDRLDVARKPNPHLGFGPGIHHCLGAHLARVVTAAAIGTALTRLPELSLASQDLQWEETFMLRGLRELRVRTGAGASPSPA